MGSNKLIADFMGVQYKSDEDYIKNLKEMRENGIYFEQGYMESELNYHKSWDWLIPVVAKCREESNAEDSHWEAICYSLEGCDRDATYNAVVEFIKWYNKIQ